MSKLKELIKSPHIHVALATAFSIILMAYVSKKILPEPMDSIPIAIPPFLMLLYEVLLGKYKNTKICTPWYWISAILLSTFIIIAIYLF